VAAFVIVAIASGQPARSALAGASARLIYVRGLGAEECPGETAIRAAVSARLGYDPFFVWAHDSLFVEITRTRGAYHAEIKLVDDQNNLRGHRDMTVKGDDCGAIVDATGLTISLTIDPSSVLGVSTPARAPDPPPTAPSPPPAVNLPVAPPALDPPAVPPAVNPPVVARVDGVRDEEPTPPRAAETGLRWYAGAGALVALGAEPSLSPGAEVFVGARWKMLSLDLEGRADLPATGASEQPPARVQSWLLAGAVVPCGHVGYAFGCPILEVGSLQATSVGTTSPRVAQDLWAAAGGRIGVELPLAGRLFLRGYGEALGTLRRETLSIGNATAYLFPPASGGIGAALVLRFP
jgi:hypothetical protein